MGASCLISWARSTRELAPELLAVAGGGIITMMGRDRTQQATSDPFSTASSGEPSPPTKKVLPAQERRHLLPKDLPNAVNYLNDEELDRLLTVALAEARRRGRSLPAAQPSRTRQQGEGTASLPRGQLKTPFALLSKLASRLRGLPDSSAYPNQTCGKHWRARHRGEELSTNPVSKAFRWRSRHAEKASYGSRTLHSCNVGLIVGACRFTCRGEDGCLDSR